MSSSTENNKKQLKILCIGDQHFKTSNIVLVDMFIQKLKSHLDKYTPDIIISMGDLLDTHERLHTIPLNKAGEYFKLLSSYCSTYVLVGNHDSINNSVFLTTNHWMNCFKEYNNLNIIDNVSIVNINDIKITMCPYVPDGKFIQALNTKKGEWEDSKCIFAHQLFDGAKMGAIVAENVEKWDDNLPLIISGHIHDKQQVQQNLYYTGSSMQHAFGESADKTILEMTLSNDNPPIYSEIDLNLPKKKIIYMEMNELEKFDVSTLKTNTEYKLTIDGSYEEFEAFRKTSKYKNITKKGIKIVFKHKRLFIAEKKEQVKEKTRVKDSKSFKKILEELIKKENNSLLDDLMSTIVFNQTKDDSDDIIIIDDN